jgi:hypothetical protein
MMPGMAPPPPGAYIPGPFVQQMPYPPSMPPPNGEYRLRFPLLSLISYSAAMYTPQMGQMPRTYMDSNFKHWTLNTFSAPQSYMQAPPPGQYPPPPNGAGPRPSMPPTPIPAHAHPYYHQSPQRMSHDFSFTVIDEAR